MHAEAWKLLTSLDEVQLSPVIGSHSPNLTVQLSDCTGHLCRLKLIGPFAHQVLVDTLVAPSICNSDELGNWDLWNIFKEYSQACLIPQGCSVGLVCDNFLKNRSVLFEEYLLLKLEKFLSNRVSFFNIKTNPEVMI